MIYPLCILTNVDANNFELPFLVHATLVPNSLTRINGLIGIV
jgi:hypothetical protein